MEHLPQAYSYFDDEEFCQSLLKHLQSFTSLPESPSIKTGLTKGDRLSFVSDVLLQDDDMQLSWNCSIVQSDDDDYDDDADDDDDSGSLGSSSSSSEEEDNKESGDESTLRHPGSEEKTAPSTSNDVDTNVSEEPAGSTQNCRDLTESQETDEFTSDYYSTGDETSNQSEEEIDVVTVKHEPVGQQLMNEEPVGQQLIDEEEVAEHHARVSHIFEIEQKHNYAARPLCSPPTSGLKKWSHVHKAWITVDTEEEEKERRQTHNVLEKKRRKMMTKCFGRLRDTMPELYRNDKAPKILILQRARDFIRDLEAQAYRLGCEESTLRARQEELKAHLKHIKRTIGW
nr:myc proto-oncogene protein-like [Nerophis lumbriciformis]